MSKKPQVGDIIHFKPEYHEAIKELHDNMMDSECSARFWAKNQRICTQNFWDFIRKQAPEADGFLLSYNDKTNSVMLMGHPNLREELQERSQGSDANVTQILDIAKDMLVCRQEFEAAATVRDISDAIKKSQ